MVANISYYELLGVQPNASNDEIKNAFKSMAKSLHPDKNPHGKCLMQQLNVAKEILLDPSKRAQYDRELRHRQGGENNGVGSSSAEEERLRSVLESTLVKQKALKKEVKELRSRQKVVNKEVRELRSKNSFLNNDAVALNQKIEEQKGQIANYEDKLDRVSRELRGERTSLFEEKHNYDILLRELKKVEKQCSTLNETNEDLKSENKELVSEVKDLQHKMKDASKELKNVKAKNSKFCTAASEHCSKHHKMVETYEGKMDRISRELREARHKATTLHTKMADQNEWVFKFFSMSYFVFTALYIVFAFLAHIMINPEGGETNQYTLLIIVYSLCYCIFWVHWFCYCLSKKWHLLL